MNMKLVHFVVVPNFSLDMVFMWSLFVEGREGGTRVRGYERQTRFDEKVYWLE